MISTDIPLKENKSLTKECLSNSTASLGQPKKYFSDNKFYFKAFLTEGWPLHSFFKWTLPPFNVSGYFSSCLFCNIHWAFVSKQDIQEHATLLAPTPSIYIKKKKVEAQNKKRPTSAYSLNEAADKVFSFLPPPIFLSFFSWEGSCKIDQACVIQTCPCIKALRCCCDYYYYYFLFGCKIRFI